LWLEVKRNEINKENEEHTKLNIEQGSW
jgi:hypothetical protein